MRNGEESLAVPQCKHKFWSREYFSLDSGPLPICWLAPLRLSRFVMSSIFGIGYILC
jgi:hypothetical protein